VEPIPDTVKVNTPPVWVIVTGVVDAALTNPLAVTIPTFRLGAPMIPCATVATPATLA
jgi:hypothetical protein